MAFANFVFAGSVVNEDDDDDRSHRDEKVLEAARGPSRPSYHIGRYNNDEILLLLLLTHQVPVRPSGLAASLAVTVWAASRQEEEEEETVVVVYRKEGGGSSQRQTSGNWIVSPSPPTS